MRCSDSRQNAAGTFGNPVIGPTRTGIEIDQEYRYACFPCRMDYRNGYEATKGGNNPNALALDDITCNLSATAGLEQATAGSLQGTEHHAGRGGIAT
mgnify:CR=1 FL=1